MRRYLLRHALALGGLCFAAALPLNTVLAQEQTAAAASSPTGLEEIVVTARRVEENLMTVPASVSVMTSKNIDDMGIKDMTEISMFEPSFHMVNQTGGASGIPDRSSFLVTFRGLNEGSTGVNTTGSGSVFIDGAPVIDAQIPSLDEIERVEVLKGPQSAYFGRSTFAGAINYITKDPSLTAFTGNVDAESSSYNSTDESFAASGPIINDVLSARVSGRHMVKGGEWLNAADPDQHLGDEETDSVAGTVLFVPTNTVKVKGWLNWFTMNDGPPPQADIKSTDTYPGTNTRVFNCSFPGAAYVHGYLCGRMPYADQLNPANISFDGAMTPFLQSLINGNSQHYQGLPFNPDFLDHAGLRRNALQGDVKLDWEFLPGYNFSSLSAYHFDKVMQIIDLNFRDEHDEPNPFYTGGNPPFPLALSYNAFNLAVQRLVWDVSQEFRVTSPQDQPFKWSFGGSYLYAHSPGSSLFGQWEPGATNIGNTTPTSTETPALFGGVTYEFLPKLSISFETRYQWDKLTEQTTFVDGAPSSGPGSIILSSTYHSFSPRLSLDYAFAPDSTAYVLFSRGYRPGGFNTQILVAPTGPQAALGGLTTLQYLQSLGANTNTTYQQERLDNYEFGVKSTFLENRARVTASFYYDKWINGQIATLFTVPQQNQYSPIANVGLTDLYGIEFTGDLQATSHLKFNTAFAINDTNVKSYAPCSDCLDFIGPPYYTGATSAHGHVPEVPKYTAAVSAEYTDRLTGEWNWYTRWDYSYQGSVFGDYSNVNWTPAANIVNAHLGFRNESLTVEGFVKNLTNQSAPLSSTSQVDPTTFFSPPQPADIRYDLPDKRQFGVRASYHF